MGRKQGQQVVKQAGQTKCYVWTLNNYTEEEIFEISTSVFNTTKKIEYICFGKEIGDSGTPHLQGYLELTKKGIKTKNVLFFFFLFFFCLFFFLDPRLSPYITGQPRIYFIFK